MSIKVYAPTLGESVLEASVGKWHIQPGAFVKKDDLLVEIETDKVTLEVVATAEGHITEHLKPTGSVVKPKEVMTEIIEGQAPQANEPKNTPQKETLNEPKLEEAEKLSPINNQPLNKPLTPSSSQEVQEKAASIHPDSANEADLLKDGLEAEHEAETNQEADKRIPMSPIRKRIAQRLKESQNTAATLTTFNEIDLSAIKKLREEYQKPFTEKYGAKLGWMGFFAQASIKAIQNFPVFNSYIDGSDIVTPKSVHLSVAVSTPSGLVTPVIRQAEKLSIAELEQHIGRLASKARDRKLAPSDLDGGTFTITNGGTFGSMLSTPILNPPQTGILGMHKIQDRPVVIDGSIVIRPMMYVALSYDHRLADGQEAVSFLVYIKQILENPGAIWLGL